MSIDLLKSNLPVTFTSNHTARRLKQTVWTIPTNYLFRNTSRTLYLMTVLTVQQLFRWI